MQESGRAGRNGSDSETVLCHDKAVSRHASKAVKNYVENTSICHRKVLFKEFLFTNTDTQQQNISWPVHDVIHVQCCATARYVRICNL